MPLHEISWGLPKSAKKGRRHERCQGVHPDDRQRRPPHASYGVRLAHYGVSFTHTTAHSRPARGAWQTCRRARRIARACVIRPRLRLWRSTLTGRFRMADFGLGRTTVLHTNPVVVTDVMADPTLTVDDKARYGGAGIG